MVGNEEKVDGKEEKSWINLFSKYYGGTHQISWPGIEGSNADTIVLLSSFDFLLSGHYEPYNGVFPRRVLDGTYWSIRAYSRPDAHFLSFNSGWLAYQDGYGKGRGQSLRCVAR